MASAEAAPADLGSLIKLDFGDLISCLNASTQAVARTEQQQLELRNDVEKLKQQLDDANTRAGADMKARDDAEAALQSKLQEASERNLKLETDLAALQVAESAAKAQLKEHAAALESTQREAAQKHSAEEAAAGAVKEVEERLGKTIEALTARVAVLEAREEEAATMASGLARCGPETLP